MKRIALLLSFLFASSLHATVITFDEEDGVFDYGYQGLIWDHFARVHTPTYFIQDSGYIRGNISPEYTALTYRSQRSPATVRAESGTFDFNGMYITAAWQNNLRVHIDGLLNGSRIYSQMFTIDDDAPIFTDSDFIGIDTLSIYTIAGTDAGTRGDGPFLAIDNFIINELSNDGGSGGPGSGSGSGGSSGGGSGSGSGGDDSDPITVAEPSSLTLLCLGLLGISIYRRKKC